MPGMLTSAWTKHHADDGLGRGFARGVEGLGIPIGAGGNTPGWHIDLDRWGIEGPGVKLHATLAVGRNAGGNRVQTWPGINHFDPAKNRLIEAEVEAYLVQKLEQEKIVAQEVLLRRALRLCQAATQGLIRPHLQLAAKLLLNLDLPMDKPPDAKCFLPADFILMLDLMCRCPIGQGHRVQAYEHPGVGIAGDYLIDRLCPGVEGGQNVGFEYVLWVSVNIELRLGIFCLPAAIVLGDAQDYRIEGGGGGEKGVSYAASKLAGYTGVVVLPDEQKVFSVLPADHLCHSIA
jgi:hypothetical protein